MSFHAECSRCGESLEIQGDMPAKCECGGKLFRTDSMSRCSHPCSQAHMSLGDGNYSSANLGINNYE